MSLATKQTLTNPRHEFKVPLGDDWALPCAHYEMAALAWNEKDLEGVHHKAKVQDCEEWLEKIHKWSESYVLETRMSFKISTSCSTIQRHKKVMGF